MIAALSFYLFATVLCLSAFKVVTSRNPVHSVLFLILAFFNAAGLFVLLGAEFIAMLLVIVYVGAVAVLFLFVVMMLDVSVSDLRREAVRYAPIGLGLAGVLLAELVLMYANWRQSGVALKAQVVDAAAAPVQNTEALGHVLYTANMLPFQICGLILFVAMIGAIVLTHRERAGVRRQNIAEQVARRADDAMVIESVTSGEGVKNV